jgi:pantoate--beta-alanine ligase
MRVIRSAGEMQDAALALRRGGRRIGLVPTMGALHAGHLSLIARARAACDALVVSLFVNPAQFGPGDDLSRYPRPFEQDAEACRAAGADVLFAPGDGEIYPDGFGTWVDVGGPARRFEGQARPGHFRGVATVVLKLFQIVQPHAAVFGQKDAQQAAIIHRLVRDLDLPVRLEIAPTVREPDGLALSSRNRFLDDRQRRDAPALYAALCGAASLCAAGARSPAAEDLKSEVRRALESTPGVRLEYVEVVDAETFEPLERADAPGALLIAAAACGPIRLIDNLPLAGRRAAVRDGAAAGPER